MIYEHIFLNDIRNTIHNTKIIDFIGKNSINKSKKLVAKSTGKNQNGPGRI